jgi:hypothetical protein
MTDYTDEELDRFYAKSIGWQNGVDDWFHRIIPHTTIDDGASRDHPWHLAYAEGYIAGWHMIRRKHYGDLSWVDRRSS